MTGADRMKQIQEVFHATLKCAPQERADFLKQACAADPELHGEVKALLAAHEEAEDFLEVPAFEQNTVRLSEASTLIQPPAIPRTISHYQTISLLGKGGMGEVYLATDTNLGRKAALKILPTRYTTEPDLVHRFEREAKAASALNHPNILTVYEIGKTEDSHFIATEFIEGETLRQRIVRGNLPLKEALDIAIQIAAALTAAHEAGIIHRDIKPENIMLRPDGYVKVLDFGLAKLTETSNDFTESTTTQTGLIMGTPSYMSPEQARGQKVGHHTDIWSLGVVLYELVSGARPFGGESQADLLVAILEREPMPLPEDLPPELAHTIQQALAKDPQQRLATAREFGRDLKTLQRKLELASGLKHLAPPIEEVTLKQVAEAPTLQMSPVLATAPVNAEPATVQQAIALAAPAQKLTRQLVRGGVVGLVLVVGLAVGSWYWFKRAPSQIAAPPVVQQSQRELTWWLTVQRMLGGKLEGKPFQSHGRLLFTNGSRFKFSLTSPQAGYLYLLNEGPTTGGQTSLNLLYPTPANGNLNAAVAANQPIQTGNYVLSEHEGEEKFWIVWATQPVSEIEAVKADAAAARSEIKDASQRAAILALLQQHAPKSEAKLDETKEQTTVTASSDILASIVRLKHK